MNEEEKKAIEFIKNLITWDVRQDLCPNKEECENLETILNLIKKLQKSNEELKSKNETLEELLQGNLYELYKYYKELAGTYQGNCIPIQKVKDKIEKLNDESHAEELEDIMNRKNYTITELVQYVLQELLGKGDE